tara:strand:+ start:2116 stop:2343 length:228 start_codon:yes stop_codon:yes gene_type:complete
MKTPEEIKEIKSKFNTSEISDINWLSSELETFIKTDEVSMQGLTTLENMINTLNNFRRTYTQRVVRLMKSGHIVD